MDDDNGRIEYVRQQSRISDDGISFYRSLLDNAGWCEQNPTEAQALRASVDQALSTTAQSLQQEPDGRTPQQAAWDRRMGVTYENDRPSLPSELTGAIDREAAGELRDPVDDPITPAMVKEQLAAIGLDPQATIAAATLLLQQTGMKVEASKLSAPVLAQLAIFADHLAKHAQTRPR
jgi:hypothetical protein